MPGYNHYADCSCGWCVKTRQAVAAQRCLFVRSRFETFESFTIPNASCPECGARVFFYQSPYGGRVYFDELGPPWPKHPCTDQSYRSAPAIKLATSINSAPSEQPPKWRTTGWQPLRIIRVYPEDDWWVLRAEILETGIPLRLLVEAKPSMNRGAVAFFSGWNNEGYGTVSYLEDAVEISLREIPVYRYADYVLEPRAAAILKRQRRNG